MMPDMRSRGASIDTLSSAPPEIYHEAVTPRSVATECMESAGGDWERAAALMRQRIEADNDLFRELMKPLVDAAIWSCIRQSSHATRRLYSVIPRRDDASGLTSVANRQIKKWMDFPLSGGMRLGDADREKLLEEVAVRDANVKTNAAYAAFFTAIAKRIDGKTVSEALTEEQLAKIAGKIL